MEDVWREEVCVVLNFMALSLNVVNLEPCELDRMGHHPKMFLYMLDELMYICKGLGEDHDVQQIITFEILSLAWKHYLWHKCMCQVENMTHSDAMHHICYRDWLGLCLMVFWPSGLPLLSQGVMCGIELYQHLPHLPGPGGNRTL